MSAINICKRTLCQFTPHGWIFSERPLAAQCWPPVRGRILKSLGERTKFFLGREFLNENWRVRNKKTRTRSRKKELAQENTPSTKKASKKIEVFCRFFGRERVRVFLFSFFLTFFFFYEFPALNGVLRYSKLFLSSQYFIF